MMEARQTRAVRTHWFIPANQMACRGTGASFFCEMPFPLSDSRTFPGDRSRTQHQQAFAVAIVRKQPIGNHRVGPGDVQVTMPQPEISIWREYGAVTARSRLLVVGKRARWCGLVLLPAGKFHRHAGNGHYAPVLISGSLKGSVIDFADFNAQRRHVPSCLGFIVTGHHPSQQVFI